MLQCFATMTTIFTIISMHGEINGKFAKTQPTILTNACCNLFFATMTIAFIVIGVCAVRLMENLNYWLLMRPPEKTFKLWIHIYYYIKFYYFISSCFQQNVFYICNWCRWGLLPYSKPNSLPNTMKVSKFKMPLF
jgi:hypothetical protein